MEIEQIKALYFDDKALREPAYTLKRFNWNDIRWYFVKEEPELVFYPSWTSVFDKVLPLEQQLLKWYCSLGYDNAIAYRDKRAVYGTILHVLCADTLINGSVDLNNGIKGAIATFNGLMDWKDDLTSDLIAWVQFVNEHEVKPLAIEVSLLSKFYGVAGTIDLVCEMKSNKKTVTAIVDIKSGRHGFSESNELQLHGYKAMWNENFPESKVEKVFNWSPKAWEKAPTYTLKDQSESKAARLLPNYIEIFHNKHEKPGNIMVFGGQARTGLETGGLYKRIPVEEYIKAKEQRVYPIPGEFIGSADIPEEPLNEPDFFNPIPEKQQLNINTLMEF